VLLVEDDRPLGAIVRRNLEARGYRVVQAETGAQALAAVEAETPAATLLDVNLPDQAGWDVLRTLGTRCQAVPTVVLTAVPASQARLAEFRPAAYLPEPFPLEALLATVERLRHASSARE
jgi:two-component system KDP operon response regulator KdpE